MNHILETDRLYLRAWQDSDLANLHILNSDSRVMNFFPGTLSLQESEQFLHRMMDLFGRKSYAYLPVFTKHSDEFVGFVGLADQQLDDMEFIDIGWRLLPSFWKNGYGTEMAKAVMNYGFLECKIPEILAIAPAINLPSLFLMKKLGMKFIKEFPHPKLSDYPLIETCHLYKINQALWKKENIQSG